MKSGAGFRLREDHVKRDGSKKTEALVFGKFVPLRRRTADSAKEAGELARVPKRRKAGAH